MDPADLLDYALGRLDGPRREQIERRIATDPALAGRVARLIRNLGRLLDDGHWLRPSEATSLPHSTPALPMRQDTVSLAQSGDHGDRQTSDPR